MEEDLKGRIKRVSRLVFFLSRFFPPFPASQRSRINFTKADKNMHVLYILEHFCSFIFTILFYYS